MPWAIMDQAVGLPTLNSCFVDGTFFVANHLSGGDGKAYATENNCFTGFHDTMESYLIIRR
jgi:hypothetical protein